MTAAMAAGWDRLSLRTGTHSARARQGVARLAVPICVQAVRIGSRAPLLDEVLLRCALVGEVRAVEIARDRIRRTGRGANGANHCE